MADTSSGDGKVTMRLFLMLLLLCSHSALSKGFDTEPQALETIDLPDRYRRINYSRRYSLAMPDELKTERLSPGSSFFLITTSKGKNGKAVFVVDEILASSSLLRPERYGLKGSRRDLLTALYDKNYISNDEVFETRQLFFELSHNVEVYTRDGFIFFRKDR